MDRHEGLQNAHSMDMHTGLYLPIKMDRISGPQTALTIELHRVL
jgi:hypothetical protein